jgi:transcriptional regulator with XRE-family HTH domain
VPPAQVPELDASEPACGRSAEQFPVETGTGRTSHPAAVPTYVGCVDNRNEIREFLATRRAKISPDQAGLPAYGGNRRVPGLRREEVALLAGVSVDYYTRLERGNLTGASDSVVEALARALQLDDAERAHLFDLARAANAGGSIRRRRPTPQRVRPGVQRVLDAITGAPAWIRNGRADVLTTNRLGRALYAPVFDDLSRPANTARFAFLDPRATAFYVDWERTADDMVGVLRAEAGRNPYDRGLTDLVGELSTRSEAFRTRWAAHNVHFHRTGFKQLHHPVVGDLDLTYEAMELISDPGLTLLVYTAEQNSPTQDALNLLASWAATLDQDELTEAPHTEDRS